jgi:hypothetical protein
MNPSYEYFQFVAFERLYICAKKVMLLQKGFEPIFGLVAPPQARASIHTLMNKYPIFWKSTTLGCIEVKRTACQLRCRPNGLLLSNSVKIL